MVTGYAVALEDGTKSDGRTYRNGTIELHFPEPRRDTSLVVHPLMSLRRYPDCYKEGLFQTIEEDWRSGRQIAFMLQTPDPRFRTHYPPEHFHSRKYGRRYAAHNQRATRTLEEALSCLNANLPHQLIDQSGYFVSEYADPRRVRLTQVVSKALSDVLLSLGPTTVVVHGELFYPYVQPTVDGFGCVNNVLAICQQLDLPTELGVVFANDHRR